MNSFLSHIDEIALILGVVASIVGAYVSFWSAKKTRQQFYDEYMNRKSRDKDI